MTELNTIYYKDGAYIFNDLRRDLIENYQGDNLELIIEIMRTAFSAQDGMTVADGDLNFILVNSLYEEILGASWSQIKGRKTTDLAKEGFYKESAAFLARESKQEEILIQEQRYGTNAMITATPILDSNGNVYRVMSTIRDIPMIDSLYSRLKKKDALLEEYKREDMEKAKDIVGDIVAESNVMKNVVSYALRVANVKNPVLILGESGVGKGLIANLIHNGSNRAEQHMVSVNCSAIPESLLESELFGYEPGAFTGANASGKIGLFEAADGGTVFLDEIGEMPLRLQPKILQFLESGEFMRVGSVTTRKVDVRVIAATNRDLRRMVLDRTFREDLYYRLNVVPITIPPLRERKEDILKMSLVFLKQANERNGIEKRISGEVLALLENYNWPGNCRQLRNVIERMAVLCIGDKIERDDLIFEEDIDMAGIQSRKTKCLPVNLQEAVREYEDEYIDMAMRQGGSIREAAKLLKITPSMMYRKINR